MALPLLVTVNIHYRPSLGEGISRQNAMFLKNVQKAEQKYQKVHDEISWQGFFNSIVF
jgi:hypothetical protein